MELAEPREVYPIIGLVCVFAYSIVGYVKLSSIKDAKRKKRFWNWYVLLLPFFFTTIAWLADFDFLLLAIIFIATFIAAMANVFAIDFCDDCYRMLKGRNRHPSGLLCRACSSKKKN